MGHIRWSKLIFAHNVSELNLAFCLPKEKIELFFKNRKSTSTWLRLTFRYYESKVHTLKMFLNYYHDIRYSKHFLSFFGLQNENYAWFLNKNSIKIFFQVLDITYHDKLLEICFWVWFFISDNAGSIWAMQVNFRFLKKKVQFFPLEGKKLTCSHFVQKQAQIVEYNPTIIGIV